MTTNEKLETLKTAATEALEKLAEARELLEEAEAETGYDFGYQINQELNEQSINSLAAQLVDITDGTKDADIKSELGEEEEEDEDEDAE